MRILIKEIEEIENPYTSKLAKPLGDAHGDIQYHTLLAGGQGFNAGKQAVYDACVDVGFDEMLGKYNKYVEDEFDELDELPMPISQFLAEQLTEVQK